MGFSGFGSSNLTYVKPSGDLTGVTDASNISNAIAAMPASGGSVILDTLSAVAFNILAGVVSVNRSGVYIYGLGRWATPVNSIGTGDTIRMFDSSPYSARTINGGGILGLSFNGSAAGGGSAALHVGDILQLEFDVAVLNYNSSAASKGVYLDNNYFWTEQLKGHIFAQNCSSHVVFDNSANLSGQATGSFDRADLRIHLAQNGFGDGVVFQNGALIADGVLLGVYGNFVAGASQFAVLRFTGSNGIGFSKLASTHVRIGVELDAGAGTVPITLFLNAAGNVWQRCSGHIAFSTNLAFTPCNAGGQVEFTGVVSGDANLVSALNLGTGGLAIAGNGQNIFTFPYSILRCNPGVTSFTGLTMSAGTRDGQIFMIVNPGTGSLTFAAAASNVSGGSAVVINGGTSAFFIWTAAQALWYPVNL